MDFGLAKALDTASESDPSQSPTVAAGATQTGMMMGTAAYMSPEQARGKPVDKRTDIWAFGAVLFEMLTGERAFPGQAIADSVARIIERDPDLDALPRDVPPSLRLLVRRCLEKDRRDRLRDIGDARIEIKHALAAPPANDTYRNPSVPASSEVEAVQVLGRKENRRRQREIEGYKLGGLLTAVAGVGVGIFLYFLIPDRPIYVVGLIPLMVGLAMLLYGVVLAPRPSAGKEAR